MGPPENLTCHCEKKEARARQRPVRRPRARQCLLKGCERRFHPEQARQHYCSSECREAAREWSEWKARRKYRATAAGKRKRNGQSQRTGSASKSENRLRKRQFQKPRGSSLRNFFDGCCDRPGCYECFVRSRRSPRQRFCSHACRRAMECVWERERRWRRRRDRVPHLGRARPQARQP